MQERCLDMQGYCSWMVARMLEFAKISEIWLSLYIYILFYGSSIKDLNLVHMLAV